MLPAYAYYTILGLTCLYVLLKGGAPERVGASIIGVGSILTTVALSAPAARFGSVEIGVLLVDIGALGAFLVLSLRAERFWPLCVTALQVIGTAAHAVKLVDPNVIRWAYAIALTLWTYLMLLLLVLGTWNHQKRLARNGVDKSWSTFSGRWDRPPPGGPIS